MVTMIVCKGPCGLEKIDTDFPRNPSKKSGRDSYCLDCKAARQRKRYADGPGFFYELKRRYGLSETVYKSMRFRQKDCCAICSESFGDRKPSVDHNHSTGEVRGLLCHGCNAAIGLLKEDPKRILGALKYLATHNNVRKLRSA